MILQPISKILGILCIILLIVVLLFYGRMKASEVQYIAAEKDLKQEKNISSELAAHLELSQNESNRLTKQLKEQEKAFQDYKVKADNLNKELLDSREKIRVLEREDAEVKSWSDITLPTGVIGLLNVSEENAVSGE